MMQFVVNALKAQQEKKSLSAIVAKNLEGQEPARSFDVIHASMLTGYPEFCPREVAILDVVKKPLPAKWHSMAQQICYDQGKALEKQARNYWFEGHAVGDWQCVVCGSLIQFTKRPKVHCYKCKAKKWVYREMVFLNPDVNVQGAMDLFVDFGDGKHVLTEVKTEDKDSFKSLKMPRGEHRVRTNLYLWLLRTCQSTLKDRFDLNRAKVLYISKAFGTKGDDSKISPLKEYWVEYDDDAAQVYVAKAKQLQLFRKMEKSMFPPGVCPNSFCARAKQCSVMKECWSGKFLSWEK